MKWSHIRVGREGGVRVQLVLRLGLAEDDDGHRGTGYNMHEAGRETLRGAKKLK